MLSGFDHITLTCSSLDEAVASHAALLGSAPTYRGVYPDLGTQSALFGFQNGLVELVGPLANDERAAGLQQLLSERGEGPYALAFACEDAKVASQDLRNRGVRTTSPEEGSARSADGIERTFATAELSPRATRGISLLLVQRNDASSLRGSMPKNDSALHAIDHIVVRTSNVEAAKQLYGKHLGLRLALERELAGTQMLFFRSFGITLEVIEDKELSERDKIWGIAYRTCNIQAAHQRLQEAGVTVSDVRPGNKPGTRVLTVQNPPCGTPTLVIEDPARER